MNESPDPFVERIADELKGVADNIDPPDELDGMIAARRAARRRRQNAGRVAIYALGCALVIGSVVWVRHVRNDTDTASPPEPVPTSDASQDASQATTATTAPVPTAVADPSGVPLAATSTTQPLPDPLDDLPEASSGDVSVNDPLPAQVDAVTDPVVAEAAVRYAYQHWILVDLDKNVRGQIVENGEQHADLMDTNFKAARNVIGSARIAVDAVTFTDAEHADVSFEVMFGGVRSSIFPDVLAGTALYQNGSWRIASRSLCLLAFNVGQGCSGQYPDSPSAPLALKLELVPAGFVWQGPAPANVLAVGGMGQWTNPTTSEQFVITATALAGVSTLTGQDAADLLDARAPVGDGALDITVGDRPGRGYQSGPNASLSYIRADNVIVQMGGNATLDQFIAMAASLQPTDELPPGVVVNSSVPSEPGD